MCSTYYLQFQLEGQGYFSGWRVVTLTLIVANNITVEHTMMATCSGEERIRLVGLSQRQVRRVQSTCQLRWPRRNSCKELNQRSISIRLNHTLTRSNNRPSAICHLSVCLKRVISRHAEIGSLIRLQ